MTARGRKHRGRARGGLRPLGVATAAAVWLILALPALVLAHPLGNFTINHYAGVRVSPDEIRIDAVLDRAEIPTFQERLALDADDDGELADAEAAAAREPGCRALASSLELTIDGKEALLEVAATGLSFPPGAGGLPTMRLVCQLVAPIDGGVGNGRAIVLADRSFPDRLGWREIVVEGDGTTIVPEGDVPSISVSSRLTAYPDALVQTPLAMTEVRFAVVAGGPALAPFVAPDAQPLGTTGGPAGSPGAGPSGGAVPGGIGAEIPDVFRAADLSPAVLVLALGTAFALGAGHALTPGHGKTLMAAYLVGTRGTAVHALGLGLSVTVSHTLGILALAALVVGAQGVLPADVIVRWTPLIAALTIVGIGGWMVAAEVRRRRARRAPEPMQIAAHEHAEDHDAAHMHEDHAHEPEHAHQDHGHDHDHADEPGVHAHGGVRHSHLPAAGTTITWRSLFALGLAGGIIPSTSALLILLGTIAAGRAAFGIILVVAFGLGMALVLGGVGLVLVKARGRLDRLPARSGLGRLSSWAPLGAAVLVFVLGLWLTGQAIGGGTVL